MPQKPCACGREGVDGAGLCVCVCGWGGVGWGGVGWGGGGVGVGGVGCPPAWAWPAGMQSGRGSCRWVHCGALLRVAAAPRPTARLRLHSRQPDIRNHTRLNEPQHPILHAIHQRRQRACTEWRASRWPQLVGGQQGVRGQQNSGMHAAWPGAAQCGLAALPGAAWEPLAAATPHHACPPVRPPPLPLATPTPSIASTSALRFPALAVWYARA